MLLNHNINNMNGGVSQQPNEVRYDNQVESMENFMITLAEGLRRRNPLELISSYSSTFPSNMKVHSYDRGDGLEKYVMFISDNGIVVFTDTGVEKTVVNLSTNEVMTEWAGTDWKKSIKFLTVGDTTWILNSEKTVSIKQDLTPNLSVRDRAFYWLKRSFDDGQGKGYDYTITVNGIQFTTNATTSDGGATALANLVNQRYSSPSNDPSVFPDYIRAVAVGSIVHIYVARIYAPDFRVHTGTINKFVRVKNENDIIQGYNAEDYFVSSKLITGEYKLYCTIGGVTGFYNLVNKAPTTMSVPYYSDESQAVSNTSPEFISMPLYKTTGTEEFTFEYYDSWGSQAGIGWKDKVQKLSDLPSDLNGFKVNDVGTIQVTGSDNDNFTNYYLTWQNDYWKEGVKDGIEYTFDYKTLPAKLVRQSDGTFAFGFNKQESGYDGFETVWQDREKGDDDSNPIPSFVGSTITNMFFFKNRLGFTSEENVILSETGSYYNFWATTAIEILDNDPIDASVDSNTVSIIRNVNATAGALTLWSDKGQFLLSGGEILSPATTRVSQTSYYEATNSLQPLAVDNEILFFNIVGSKLDVLVYSPASVQSDNSSAYSVANHIPNYIPSTIDYAVASSAHNLMILKDSVDLKTLYCYKYYVRGNERVISSWFKLTFNVDIKAINVLSNDLYILADDNKFIKLELQPKDIDGVFLDFGTDSYESKVVMSKFNIQTKQDSRVIRQPFYPKNIKVSRLGKIDLDIINSERETSKKILTKHLDRKIFVGGNSEKTNIGFSTSYDTGVQINALNLEGSVAFRSKNY